MISTQLASIIDHTLLRPLATPEEIERLCTEAVEHRFAAVCVNPVWVSLIAPHLRDTGVRTCTVAGFPLGASHTLTKTAEAFRAIDEGADEIDMVINAGALASQRFRMVELDISQVVAVCHGAGAICKVILETGLLTQEQKSDACRIAIDAGADFLKTSTGFGPGGATVEDVALLSGFAKPAGKGVKASGGIRTLADALKMIEVGATRIGTSSGVAIVQEAAKQSS